MDKAARDFTTFRSHCGLYRILRMPFGLKNVPVTFQRFMKNIPSNLRCQVYLVYLDDKINFSNKAADHFGLVDDVLQFLVKAVMSFWMDR